MALLKELRTAFEGEAKTSGQPRLLLTAAVPASFEAIAAGYDVPEISKYLVSGVGKTKSSRTKEDQIYLRLIILNPK